MGVTHRSRRSLQPLSRIIGRIEAGENIGRRLRSTDHGFTGLSGCAKLQSRRAQRRSEVMMRIVSSKLFVAPVLFLLSVAALAAEQTKDSLKTVKENVEAEKAVLVDVREKSEWDAGHIDGAIFLPLSELKAGLSEDELAERLPADKVLYTHCVVGKRSLTAAGILEKLGYDVRSLKPGYQELLDAGFPKAEE
jgi:rhodanese-related sulfurtransferase